MIQNVVSKFGVGELHSYQILRMLFSYKKGPSSSSGSLLKSLCHRLIHFQAIKRFIFCVKKNSVKELEQNKGFPAMADEIFGVSSI